MQTTIQTLEDGTKNVVMQLTGLGDAAGDETLAVKVDCSILKPVPPTVKLWRLEYNVGGGIVQLLWDALDPVPFLNLVGWGHFDYFGIGGLWNPQPNGVTGNILLSTYGMNVGSSYSLKLDMTKRFP